MGPRTIRAPDGSRGGCFGLGAEALHYPATNPPLSVRRTCPKLSSVSKISRTSRVCARLNPRATCSGLAGPAARPAPRTAAPAPSISAPCEPFSPPGF